MIRHKTQHPPGYIYPVDAWRMVERAFYEDLLPETETIFSLGNGYLGMRGNFEESRPAFENGTFVNGFHETWPIVYGEEAFGFPKHGQTMLNVPDGKILKLYVDDEPLYLPTADLLNFERVLDMKKGILTRELIWETAAGKAVQVNSARLVSLEHRHVVAISYEVTILNARAPVIISSQLAQAGSAHNNNGDPRKARVFRQDPLVEQGHSKHGLRMMLSFRARNSGMTMACGADHEIATECPYSYETECNGENGKVVFSVSALPGKPIRITKYLSYHTSRGAPPAELRDRANRTLDRSVKLGFSHLLSAQRESLAEFWRRSDIEVDCDARLAKMSPGALQQAIRWNLFQIHQATARAEGVGVPAKGLTGQAYEGHYFWDTEMYVLPFLIYTEPRIARNLLRFRYSMLDKARDRARELAHRGATFPWRTINGREASAYYAAGTAQFHINADIMYALNKYVNATDDINFLYTEGAEMLVETARMWADHGFYSDRRGGKFCIHAVTGPDEYTTVVDNNTYTNLMARLNLRFAAKTVERLQRDFPERYQALVYKTKLEPGETDEWRRAADNMYVPYDEQLGIHPQDDSFLEHEVWDFEHTPPEDYPLLLHYHPLYIYRHQVIKQADIVLAMFILGNEFTQEDKRHNFNYYDPLTTADSSLSACIQSIVAFDIGRIDKAMEYAEYAILMDLADVGDNMRDGCHIASMGGTWMVFTYGLAGMRDYDGKLSFQPKIPPLIKKLRFPLRIGGQELLVSFNRDQREATYLLRKGGGLTITHCGDEVTLAEGEPVTKSIPVEV